MENESYLELPYCSLKVADSVFIYLLPTISSLGIVVNLCGAISFFKLLNSIKSENQIFKYPKKCQKYK
jgi:hypothetical protein